MRKNKRRTTTAKRAPDEDAAALHGLVLALTDALGHGGLTWLAQSLGMSVSAMRKRLLKPGGGFDPVTIRALILIQQLRTDNFNGSSEIISVSQKGGYTVDVRKIQDGDRVPTWRLANGATK